MKKLVILLSLVMSAVMGFTQAPGATLDSYNIGGRYQARGYNGYSLYAQAAVTSGSSSVLLYTTTQNGGASTIGNPTCNVEVRGKYINPVFVGNTLTTNDANTETVTITAVSGCTATATFANAHNANARFTSGSNGLNEAIYDARLAGGVVTIDSKWGGTNANITSAVSFPGVALEDIRGVTGLWGAPEFWYYRPTTLSLIPAGSAPTLTQQAGGSLTSVGVYIATYEYVDAMGGISLPATDSGAITLTGSNATVTLAAPAASTGAVGYLPMITASSGANGTEILVPPTSSVCTLTTAETVIPACAMGSTAVVTANPSATAKEVVEGTAHTTFGYQPYNETPEPFQMSFGPFAVGGTVNNSAEDLAQLYIPAGYFNYLGKGWDVCVKGATATEVASSVVVAKLQMANQYAQSPVTLSTITYPTQTQAAAGTWSGCWTITTAAVGASGTFWSVTPQPFSMALNSAPGTLVQAMDVTTAASSTVDLTKGIFLSVNFGETASHNVTAPIVNSLVVKPHTGS